MTILHPVQWQLSDMKQVFRIIFFFFLVEMPNPFPNLTFGDCCKAATNLLFLLILILLFEVVRGSQRSAKHQ